MHEKDDGLQLTVLSVNDHVPGSGSFDGTAWYFMALERR